LIGHLEQYSRTIALLISGESYRLREKRRSGLIRSRLAETDREPGQRGPEVKSGPESGPDRKNR
jgi:hypothetical protein